LRKENENEPKEAPKKENPIVITLYLIFWSVLILMCVGLYTGQRDSYNELKARLTQLEAEKAEAQATAEQLEIQLTYFDSDSYIEYLARRRGMVRDNEIVFRNIAE
jgi:cell division protein DivIC